MPDALLLTCILSGTLAVVVDVWAVNALRRHERHGNKRRFGAFLRRFPWALSATLAALLCSAVAIGMQGYRALTREEVASVVTIVRAPGEDKFVATMTHPDGQTRRVVLEGDAIQIDAKVLKWAPWVNILGLHTAYALDRVQGRFDDVDRQRAFTPRPVSIAPENPVNLFAVAKRFTFLTPVVDATYGSSSFVPAQDGSRYELRVSTSGLLFRPAPL